MNEQTLLTKLQNLDTIMLVNLEQAIKLRALQQMHNGVGFDNNAMRWYLMMINEEILVRDGKCKRIDGGCVYVCDSA